MSPPRGPRGHGVCEVTHAFTGSGHQDADISGAVLPPLAGPLSLLTTGLCLKILAVSLPAACTWVCTVFHHLTWHLSRAGKLVPGSSERTECQRKGCSLPPSHLTPTCTTYEAPNVQGHGSTLSIPGTLPGPRPQPTALESLPVCRDTHRREDVKMLILRPAALQKQRP